MALSHGHAVRGSVRGAPDRVGSNGLFTGRSAAIKREIHGTKSDNGTAGSAAIGGMRSDTQRRVRYASGYTELGMFAEAVSEIQAVAPEDRFAPAVLTAQVNLCLETKEWEAAVRIGQCLTKEAPELEVGWISRAFALRELGRIEEARDCLLEAEPRHGATSAVLHYNLACYYSLLGDLATARVRLERACKMEPRFKTDALKDRDLEALRRAS